MKIEDCRRGMLVLATKKSYKYKSMEDFLKYAPLSIGEIESVEDTDNMNEVVISIDDKHTSFGFILFSFKAEDLICIGE